MGVGPSSPEKPIAPPPTAQSPGGEPQPLSGISRIVSIVKERAPELLPELRTPASISSPEYTMMRVVQLAKNKAVKSELVRGFVETGQRPTTIIEILTAAKSSELDLPEYGEGFFLKKYQEELGKDSYWAYAIARDVYRNMDSIFKLSPTQAEEAKARWLENERVAWQRHIEATLAEVEGLDDPFKQNEGAVGTLELIFDGEFPHYVRDHEIPIPAELRQRIVRAAIETNIKAGWHNKAWDKAVRSGYSEEELGQLRKRIYPTRADKIRDWWKARRQGSQKGQSPNQEEKVA